MEPSDLAWLSGLLEGEGSFFMITSRSGNNRGYPSEQRRYRYPQVVVNMTDQDVIERAARLMDAGVYTMPLQPNRKQQWRTLACGAKAVRLLEALLPQMGKRRSARINELLTEYRENQVLTTTERRAASCSVAAAKRSRTERGQFVGNS
jgi:hypothetical protein